MGRVDAAMRRAEAARGTQPEPEVNVPLLPPPTAHENETKVHSSVVAKVTSTVRVEDLDPAVARKVVVDQQMLTGSREQYRRLAASLHQAQIEGGVKAVMISSAVPGEGKTLTASNLGLTLSESYHRRVLIIDADLRRPSLHRVFQLPMSPGLTETLADTEDRKLPLHKISDNLSVLTAGTASLDPMAGLTSPRLRRILVEARRAFDWVLVDTPPVGLLTDASLLASHVDGTLFVVKAGETPYHLVKRATEMIGADKMLGVVLNRAAPDEQSYGGYKHYAGYRLPTDPPASQ